MNGRMRTPSIGQSAYSLHLLLIVFCSLFILAGCSTNMKPLKATDTPIELDRFMGDWYIIGSIPIDLFFASEVGAHNAVETYTLLENGKIDTRYRFRKDSFDGPLKTFNPTATVFNTDTNTEWRMQFIWPFSSAYLITHIEPDYSHTIIGVPDRSYIWIMSRIPDLSAAEYQRLLDIAAQSGYDIARIQRIPQRWPEAAAQ
jgi:apolipoprotein D and lipocalin family protein